MSMAGTWSAKARKKGKEVKKFDNMEMPGFLSIFNDMYIVLLYRHADLLCRADFPDRKALRYDGHRLQPH